jgi:hypothetical protein
MVTAAGINSLSMILLLSKNISDINFPVDISFSVGMTVISTQSAQAWFVDLAGSITSHHQ